MTCFKGAGIISELPFQEAIDHSLQRRYAKRACAKAVATLKCNVDALGEMIKIFSPFIYIAVS